MILVTLQVNGQRLSFGMTPKTRRLPKPGEMMLSVHGSPLGVFNEDQNMEAIKGMLLDHTISQRLLPPMIYNQNNCSYLEYN